MTCSDTSQSYTLASPTRQTLKPKLAKEYACPNAQTEKNAAKMKEK